MAFRRDFLSDIGLVERSLEKLALRRALFAGLTGEAGRFWRTGGGGALDCCAGGLGSLLSLSVAIDAGTSLNEEGSAWFAVDVSAGGLSFLGRLRAAAAHERSVERLARKAAS